MVVVHCISWVLYSTCFSGHLVRYGVCLCTMTVLLPGLVDVCVLKANPAKGMKVVVYVSLYYSHRHLSLTWSGFVGHDLVDMVSSKKWYCSQHCPQAKYVPHVAVFSVTTLLKSVNGWEWLHSHKTRLHLGPKCTCKWSRSLGISVCLYKFTEYLSSSDEPCV